MRMNKSSIYENIKPGDICENRLHDNDKLIVLNIGGYSRLSSC